MSFENIHPLQGASIESMYHHTLSDFPWLNSVEFHHLEETAEPFVIDDYYVYVSEYKGKVDKRIAYMIELEDGSKMRFSLALTDARRDQLMREDENFKSGLAIGPCVLRLIEREIGNDFYVIESFTIDAQELLL